MTAAARYRRFKLMHDNGMSYAAIGRHEGVSTTRARDIVIRAKRKAPSFLGLELSTRAMWALRNYHPPLQSLDDIADACNHGFFLKMPNVGIKTVREIAAAVGATRLKAPTRFGNPDYHRKVIANSQRQIRELRERIAKHKKLLKIAERDET